MYDDLNDFIADLDKRRLLARIGEPVSPDLEIAAVTDRACKSPGGGPALLFEQPTGFDMPVASAIVYGSIERMCLALGVKTLDDLGREIDELMTPQMPEGIMDALKMLPMVGRLRDLMPKTGQGRAVPGNRAAGRHARRAADSEVLARGRRAVHHVPARLHEGPRDRRCATSAPTGCRCSTAARPACTGSGTRAARSTTGSPSASASGSRWRSRSSPEPVLPYCATAPMPEGLDELLLGGFLARRRIEMVKCVTVDLEVPASSHIVLEGYVEPGERRREGPFGDHTGLYSQPDDFPVFHLTCLTRRKQPTYLTTVVGIPPMEDYYLGLASERIFLPMIRKTLPEIVDMHFPGRGHLPQPGHRRRSTSGTPATRARSCTRSGGSAS